MIGYLSPGGEFVLPRSVDADSVLGLGYIAFKERGVYMKKFRKNFGRAKLTVKQMIWIDNQRAEFNVHQKIDLMKMMKER